ncbi:hypothetical protein EMIHUDRAFT_116051 [Emiliania huxleyi CCMP1516]|uniref:Uncharacterized protein n=2 Tax=Emiliania huxleyi TaxID=2903 RepID=A0A0D3JL19_EMIH1|nr:hypothetical protein EMIHUDRAFT_116051 [Emiliania huxleyi CCMP1516]EOD24204.1 hypothetical protein EMIHUDRAFT_116051 [Emiliania huxleyi CCMP1516]|eukprot:XP_005776633.1 hypothetical protein EMIHUDRAFT_116051 [Emiliania huxleyi CCMP1516]
MPDDAVSSFIGAKRDALYAWAAAQRDAAISHAKASAEATAAGAREAAASTAGAGADWAVEATAAPRARALGAAREKYAEYTAMEARALEVLNRESRRLATQVLEAGEAAQSIAATSGAAAAAQAEASLVAAARQASARAAAASDAYPEGVAAGAAVAGATASETAAGSGAAAEAGAAAVGDRAVDAWRSAAAGARRLAGERPAELVGAPLAFVDAVPALELRFPRGAEVRPRRLRGRADLNGRSGAVAKYDAQGGRVGVDFPPPVGLVSIRAANLEIGRHERARRRLEAEERRRRQEYGTRR